MLQYPLLEGEKLVAPTTNFIRTRNDAVIQIAESEETPTASNFGATFKILFIWKRSFYKLVWKQAIVYYIAYISVSMGYNYGLDELSKIQFDAAASFLARNNSSLPIALVLGFFTSTALNRWFNTLQSMMGTNMVIVRFITAIKEDVPDGPILVDRFIRYVLLMWVLTMRIVCFPLRRKYSTMISLQMAGLLRDSERRVLEDHLAKPSGDIATLPLIVFDWLNIFCRETDRKGYFCYSNELSRVTDALQTLKKNGGNILKISSKNMPIALIQVTTIAIYFFGLASILGHQIVEKDKTITIFSALFPLPYAMPYFMYYAWLMEGLIATYPFGEDEDDFNIISLFQNHINSALRLRNTYRLKLANVFLNDVPFPHHSAV